MSTPNALRFRDRWRCWLEITYGIEQAGVFVVLWVGPWSTSTQWEAPMVFCSKACIGTRLVVMSFLVEVSNDTHVSRTPCLFSQRV